MVLFGPTFSGSIDSIRETLGALPSLRVMHGVDVEVADERGSEPLMWTDIQGDRAQCVAIPVLANRFTESRVIRVLRDNDKTWGKQLSEALHISPVDNCGRRALYAQLASEMATYRFAIVGVAMATIASSVVQSLVQ